jgi:hypothetical protein
MSKAWPVSGIDPSATLAENARRILSVRIAEYYSYEPIVDNERAIEELHALRISAKRLRYTLELFRVVFAEPGECEIERVRDIQELLGQLHDHDVRIALIEDELNKLAVEQTAALGRSLALAPSSTHSALTAAALRPPPDDPRRGLLALLGRQYSSRHDVYVAFHQQWLRNHDEGMRAALVALSIGESVAADSGDAQDS